MNLELFPPLNATLNGLSAILLAAGYLAIRSGHRRAHAGFMISALVSSAAFLACYLTYHALKEGHVTKFPAEYPVARIVYLTILISHTLLAVVNLPMVITTVVFAARRKFDKHRRLARWTLPIWFYISVTGVIIYFMLYQWFLPTPKEASGERIEIRTAEVSASEATAGPVTSGSPLVFEPEVFSHEAEAGDKEMTATFVARNPNATPVHITKLDSSCSCVSVDADTREIPPGGTATITAVFDIEKLSGEAEKSVYVSTDVPGSRENRLVVKVTIPAVVSIEPLTVKWSIGEAPESREIRFKVLREKPIHVTGISSSRDSVSAKLDTIADGREYRITLKPESTADTMLGFVRIVTDCELEQYQRELAYFAIQNEPVQVN
ncbi:MAG: DUF420 domain-containing protein [Verrucomicrobiae bacterium]|nr:DUF420 domain-containing protein [Verrucomicrobiae bacterium]